MRGRYVETEYAYSSARIRFRENSLVTKETFERMLDAKSADEVIGIFTENVTDIKDDKIADTENMAPSERREVLLQKCLKNAYSLIEEISPLPTLTNFLKYQYDCNNIKMAIKCRIRDIAPDEMLFDIGTIKKETIIKMAADQNFSELPANMAQAAKDAVVEYAKSKNPQKIDMLIDKACFADMLQAAKDTNVPYIEKLVKAKIDLTNFMIILRVLRMKGEESNDLSVFHDSLIEGGSISVGIWKRAYENGEEIVISKLANSDYTDLIEEIEALKDNSLSAIEKICDNYWFEIAKSSKYVTYGAPVLVGYIIAVEYQIKNIRIILAGKSAELSCDIIRERMRASYV